MIPVYIYFLLFFSINFLFSALYDKIVECGQRSCISPEFVTYFESERAKGLPVDSLSVQLHVLESRPTTSSKLK